MPASRRTSSEGQLAAISVITSTENYKRNQSRYIKGELSQFYMIHIAAAVINDL